MPAQRIGLDIGRTHLRAIALRRRGKGWAIAGCAAVRRSGPDGEEKPLAAALAELDAMLPLRGEITVAAGEAGGLIRFLVTAPLAPDRLARIIRLELDNHADGGELAADHATLPIGGDEQVHCCVVAQPAQVYSLLIDLRGAGIKPTRIHHGAVALANLAIAADAAGRPLCEDERTALIVDIGSTATGIALVGRDRLLACRVLPLGGEQFTENIAATARITRGEAEAAKLSGRMPQGAVIEKPASQALDADDPFGQMLEGSIAAAPAPIPTTDLGDDPFALADAPPAEPPASAAVPAASAPAPAPSAPSSSSSRAAAAGLPPELAKPAEQIAAQLSTSLVWLRNQVKLPPGLPLGAVWICGGGAGLAGLDDHLARRFGVPVQRLDPWAVADGGAAAPAQPWEYAGAAGLALAGALPGTIALDLRPSGLLRKEAIAAGVVPAWIAAAGILVAAGLGCWTIAREQDAARQSIAAWEAARAELDRARARLKQLDDERDGLYADLRAIAGRIYAGRDFLNVIRALKLEAADENSKHLWVTRLETVSLGGGAAGDPSATVFGGTAAKDGRQPGQKPKVADTAIDRGAIEVSGYLKFQDVADKQQLQPIFQRWYDRLREWRPAGGAPLFAEGNTLFFDVDLGNPAAAGGRPRPRSAAPEGSVPFKVKYWFRPTDLAQVTAQAGGGG